MLNRAVARWQTSPVMWNSGAMATVTSPGPRSYHRVMTSALWAMARWVLIAPWVALLVYCTKSGMVTAARLISPYYPLLLPGLLVGAGQAQVIRRHWWRVMVWVVVLLAAPVVVLMPGHPLWPARTVLGKLLALHPRQPLITRALTVYTVYAVRADPLANVRAVLPQGLAMVGFMGGPDDTDISLWRPFGQRRVERLSCKAAQSFELAAPNGDRWLEREASHR